MVVLSALAVPVVDQVKLSSTSSATMPDVDENTNRLQRLSVLLFMSQPPRRSDLLKDAETRGLLNHVLPDIRSLFELLEHNFQPMSVAVDIQPMMLRLSQNPAMSKYAEPLYASILTRILQRLSSLYETIKIETLLRLSAFPPPFLMSRQKLELFMIDGCKRGEFWFYMDHARDCVHVHSPTSFLHAAHPPSIDMQTHLSHLTLHLSSLFPRSHLTVKSGEQVSGADAFSTQLERLSSAYREDRKKALGRRELIERKKEMAEAFVTNKEALEAKERINRAQQEAEAHRLRLVEESKKRELERIKREREQIDRRLAMELAEEMKKKNINISIEVF